MFINDWKKEIMTIPNLLSLFRLLLVPVYVYIYLNATADCQFFIAGTIMAVSCLTDMIDGKIARRYDMVSNLGKVLDPLADKVTQFALTLCLSLKYPVLRKVLILFLVKEGFQVIAGIASLRRGKALPGALLAGKLCTTILFVSLIALVLFPHMPQRGIRGIAMTDGLFLCISFFSYILAYYGKNTKVRDLPKE